MKPIRKRGSVRIFRRLTLDVSTESAPAWQICPVGEWPSLTVLSGERCDTLINSEGTKKNGLGGWTPLMSLSFSKGCYRTKPLELNSGLIFKPNLMAPLSVGVDQINEQDSTCNRNRKGSCGLWCFPAWRFLPGTLGIELASSSTRGSPASSLSTFFAAFRLRSCLSSSWQMRGPDWGLSPCCCSLLKRQTN